MYSQNDINYDLLGRYLAGEALPEEAIEAEDWITASEENKMIFEQLSAFWQEGDRTLPFPADKPAPVTKKKITWTWIAAAACICGLAVGTFLWKSRPLPPSNPIVVHTAGITPLQDTLPDQSVCILAPHASLRYPSSFTGHDRSQVILEGNADFMISPGATHPFVIMSGKLGIRILGTSFSVQHTSTSRDVTVHSGAVLVFTPKDSLVLKAGQTARYLNATGTLELVTESALLLQFDNTPLSVIMQQVDSVYHVKTVFLNKALMDCTFSSTFKDQSLDYIMQVLRASLSIDYRINNKTIYINGQGCD